MRENTDWELGEQVVGMATGALESATLGTNAATLTSAIDWGMEAGIHANVIECTKRKRALLENKIHGQQAQVGILAASNDHKCTMPGEEDEAIKRQRLSAGVAGNSPAATCVNGTNESRHKL